MIAMKLIRFWLAARLSKAFNTASSKAIAWTFVDSVLNASADRF